MRVSTGMIFESGVSSIQQRTSSLLRTQQQVASGRRILSPSDDPVAAARALEVSQSKEINAQYVTAQGNAKSTLGVMDAQLLSTTDLLVRVRELTVQAGNAALSSSDRKSIAIELRARFDELVALTNSMDGTGQYLFSGYQGSNKPFAGSVDSGVSYAGDDGRRVLRVSATRNLPVSQSGNDVFMRIKNGNGTFVTGVQQTASANARTASVDAVQVTNAAAWADPINSGNLEVRFWVDRSGEIGSAGQTYYDLVDATSGRSLFSNTVSAAGGAANTYTQAYVSGAAIDFSGLNAVYANPSATPVGSTSFGASIVINGVPASGDAFSITRNAATANVTASVVTDANAWSDGINSGNLQVKFWVDAAGVIGVPGNTYYDLVDASSGDSLISGSAATAGAAAYMRSYTSGGAITFDNLFSPTYDNPSATPAGTPDFGASVTVSGVPANGDSFTVTQTGAGPLFGIATSGAAAAGQITAQALQVTATQARATIDAGSVTDSMKWSNASNSGNLEVRFWVDSTGAVGSAGATYYDLVDADSGNSLFTGAPSSSGAGGSFTHAYSSGSPINFNGLAAAYNPPSNDFGATVTVTGVPASGDAFTVKVGGDALGNGYFVTEPKQVSVDNMGSGIIGAGEVIDSSKWNSPDNSRQLEIRFWKDPSDTTANAPVYYDLVDIETEKSLFTDTASTTAGTGNTYTHIFKSGDPISFSGLADPYDDFGVTVTLQGTPASGDTFSVRGSTTESVFSTLSNLIRAIESPVGPVGSNSNAGLHNSLGLALTNLSRIEDNILRVRADIGTQLSEVDDLANVSENINLQYEATLSGLQDLDYAKAITDLMRMQTELQAAQQSFMKISGLSLFNYL